MMELAELQKNFELYKGAGFALVLATTTLLQFLFPHQSSSRSIFDNWKTNLSLGVTNTLLIGLICGGCIGNFALWSEQHHYGLLNSISLGFWPKLLLAIFLLDLSVYFWHYLNHRLPLLWRFHAVHHTDQVFETTTAIRFHPVEILLSLLVRISLVMVLGIPLTGLILYEIIYLFFNHFEHGNIRLNTTFENLLGVIFITPALHRLHHSDEPSEHHRNFGTVFSFWDRFFRTFVFNSSARIIKLGLKTSPHSPNYWMAIGLPFHKSR